MKIMGPIDALTIALNKEQASIKLYDDLCSSHSDLRELCSFLITEEQKHKQMIEKKIQGMTKY